MARPPGRQIPTRKIDVDNQTRFRYLDDYCQYTIRNFHSFRFEKAGSYFQQKPKQEH
ncbi:hypothetical protein D1AOALGA4SA_9908 [Olavius algarvensis Delta 1 endosymbiont]|nr:hypothetical protein D1AOALGA4SA_9908 [Olavius algarvensis Delta 1 endosymbiont]